MRWRWYYPEHVHCAFNWYIAALFFLCGSFHCHSLCWLWHSATTLVGCSNCSHKWQMLVWKVVQRWQHNKSLLQEQVKSKLILLHVLIFDKWCNCQRTHLRHFLKLNAPESQLLCPSITKRDTRLSPPRSSAGTRWDCWLRGYYSA